MYNIVPTNKSPKHEYDTNDDEGLYRCEAVGPRNVAGDAVEDVDQNKEDSDEDGHSTGNTLRGNEEADPAHNDKHPSWEVVSNDVVGPAGNIDIFFLSSLNNRNIYIFLRRVNSNPVTE